MRVTTDRRRCARLCARSGGRRHARPAIRDTSPPDSAADQVIGRGGEGELPIHEGDAAMPELAQAPDGLHPSKDLFHEFPFPLTDVIARMPRGPAIIALQRTFCATWGVTSRMRTRPRSSPHRSPCPPRPCCPEVRWPPATAPPPRVRQSPSRGSPDVGDEPVDCPAARGPDTTWPFRCSIAAGSVVDVEVDRGIPGVIPTLKALQAGPRGREVFVRDRPAARAWAWTASKKAADQQPVAILGRLGCQTGSSMFKPTNQRNNRL